MTFEFGLRSTRFVNPERSWQAPGKMVQLYSPPPSALSSFLLLHLLFLPSPTTPLLFFSHSFSVCASATRATRVKQVSITLSTPAAALAASSQTQATLQTHVSRWFFAPFIPVCFYFMHRLCTRGLYTVVHRALRKPEIPLLLRFRETPQAVRFAQKFGAPSRRAHT